MNLELYNDSTFYDEWNKNFSEDIQFYANEAAKVSGDVLELACGTGRISIPLLQQGVSLYGIDSSVVFIQSLRSKLEKLNIESSPFSIQDIRNFKVNGMFDMIFIAFNSFLHLETFMQRRDALNCIRSKLSKGGKVFIDLFNPDIKRLNRDPNRRYFYKNMAIGHEEFQVEEILNYNDATQIVDTKWLFSTDRQKDKKVLNHSSSIMFPNEAIALFQSLGWEVCAIYGNYSKKIFEMGDKKMIFELA